MAKLCQRCFHTPAGMCQKHNPKDEYDRKFLEGMNRVAEIVCKATAYELWERPSILERWRAVTKG